MILRMSVPDFEIQALVLAFCSWFLQIMVILCVVVHSVDIKHVLAIIHRLLGIYLPLFRYVERGIIRL